jgi:hypothetical protein
LILLKPSWDNIKIHMINPENLTKVWVDALENENLSAHDPKTMDTEKIHGKSKYCPTENTTL